MGGSISQNFAFGDGTTKETVPRITRKSPRSQKGRGLFAANGGYVFGRISFNGTQPLKPVLFGW
jgi:hypothetical protein